MAKITGRLENWVYDALYNVVWGDIYDDAKGRFAPGDRIHTSDIPITRKSRNPDQFYEGYTVETLNSRYLLGKKGKGG